MNDDMAAAQARLDVLKFWVGDMNYKYTSAGAALPVDPILGTIIPIHGHDEQLAQLLTRLDALITAMADAAETNRALLDALTTGIKPWSTRINRGSV